MAYFWNYLFPSFFPSLILATTLFSKPHWATDTSGRNKFHEECILMFGISRGTCYPCESRTASLVSVPTVLIKIWAGQTYRWDESFPRCHTKRDGKVQDCRYCVFALLAELRVYTENSINPINAELNPIRHLLAFVGARHIVYVSRIRVNSIKLQRIKFQRNMIAFFL